MKVDIDEKVIRVERYKIADTPLCETKNHVCDFLVENENLCTVTGRVLDWLDDFGFCIPCDTCPLWKEEEE